MVEPLKSDENDENDFVVADDDALDQQDEAADADGDEGEGWSDYGEEEPDYEEQARQIKAELDREKQIEDNMRLIDQMRQEREALLNNPAAKLTKWRLISVKQFVRLMKLELAEEQKVPVEQVDFTRLQE